MHGARGLEQGDRRQKKGSDLLAVISEQLVIELQLVSGMH